MRRAVRAAVLGVDPGDLSSAENPEAIDELRVALKEREKVVRTA
jgi:acetyl-CoA synthetase